MASEAEILRSSEEFPNLRERILRVASELFASRGYTGTSVREVAESAGCTKPALYYHFASKEDLFHHVVGSHTDFVTAMIEKSLARPGTVRERITRGLGDYLEHVQRDPVSVRLLMALQYRPDADGPEIELKSLRMSMARLLGKLLAEGVRTGEIRSDIDLEDVVWTLVGIVDLRLQLWLEGVPVPDRLPERIAEVFFGGVGKC